MSLRTKSALLGATAAATAAAVMVPLSGCASPTTEQITAFVAANATDPFNTFIKTYENSHQNVKVLASYAGTQILETQIEQGAQVDLFLSADLVHMEKLKQEGIIDQYYPVSRTHPVLVVPKHNSAGIHTLQDLGSKQMKLIIGTDTVPIGKYTRQIFKKASAGYGPDFEKQAMSHVVSFETDVKQVLQKVALGEADAGIVYRTDVSQELAKKVTLIEIPSQYNVIGMNYVAVPLKAPHPKMGQELLKLMLSKEGQGVFAEFGYDEVTK